MSPNDAEFIRLHSQLAVSTARLPILRLEFIEAEKQLAEGFLGNIALEREAYYECLGRIKDATMHLRKIFDREVNGVIE